MEIQKFVDSINDKKVFSSSNQNAKPTMLRNLWTKFLWFMWVKMFRSNTYNPDTGHPRNVFNKVDKGTEGVPSDKESVLIFYRLARDIYVDCIMKYFFCDLAEVRLEGQDTITLLVADGKSFSFD